MIKSDLHAAQTKCEKPWSVDVYTPASHAGNVCPFSPFVFPVFSLDQDQDKSSIGVTHV
jgi:hypothetical protein